MTVIEIVRLIAKEFDNIQDSVISAYVELYSPLVSKKFFGKLYNQAIALLICHKLKMSGEGDSVLGSLGSVANSFAVGSVSDGGTSISFNSSGTSNLASDAEYTLTSYGTQFLNLRKKCVVPIHISGELI